MYEIIDTQTGMRVGKLFQKRVGASRKADRLDLEHGAIRYSVRFVCVSEY